MSEPLAPVSRAGGVATLTLNRPEKRNAIDRALLLALEAALSEVRDDPEVRAVVLRGAGSMFSSGIDHTLLMEAFTQAQTTPFRHIHGDLQRLMDGLVRMEKPVIAVLHGAAAGMGMELALAADFRIAAADCLMGLPEVAFGIIPDVGGTTRLTHLVGAERAKELILTGELVRADDPRAAGMATRVVGGGELDGAVAAFVESIIRHPAAGVGLGKILVDQVADVDRATALKLEGVYQSVLLAHPDLAEHFGPGVAFVTAQMKKGRRRDS